MVESLFYAKKHAIKRAGVVLAAVLLSALTGCAGSGSSETTEPEAAAKPSEPGQVSTSVRELYGKTWLLEGPDTVLLDPQARPDLLVNQSGRLNASTGCNTFFGNVTVDDQGAFAADLGGMSMMACPPPLDEQEDVFMRAMIESTRFEINDGQLHLLDSNGQLTLQFTPAE